MDIPIRVNKIEEEREMEKVTREVWAELGSRIEEARSVAAALDRALERVEAAYRYFRIQQAMRDDLPF